MRIAFVGKGGSGKTTLASIFTQILQAQGVEVLAIDADINQHLGMALGLTASQMESIPEVGNHLLPLKTLLRGHNTLIPTPAVMVKTTLPSEGSHLITLVANDPVLSHFALCWGANSFFMRMGGFTDADMGVSCYHAKTGGAELILNHLLDTPAQAVVVDMTAGADAFASGLFTRFDLTVVVVEPTLKSVSVYQQYKTYAQPFMVPLVVVGNKINNATDKAFLLSHCGPDILGYFGVSGWVKAAEQGTPKAISSLEADNTNLMQQLWQRAQQYPRNWQKYWEQGVFFHNKNALSWANESVGMDVQPFNDPHFYQQIKV